MKKCYTPALLAFVLLSCTTARVSYLGSSLAPTKKVDVFVDASAIKKPYSIIGRGYVDQSYVRVNTERMQENAVEKAKEKGADAILFQDLMILSDGSYVATADSTGRPVPVRGTAVTPVISSRRDILFLKYNTR